ncbi:hypothetical protein FGE12_25620 [Aggregicoccus sp. 17bor-14]|uniref:hypothetical protein n=1 Tax=Myxococcaceae TaxID=31 RepID=UPI00129C7DED|nr:MULTISPECIES: hypothetical protein [Myxococcaceae]MBF5045813.1 hypothetical protein [Simulacricoccus sp. 17bor-14]MRI91548.1 hypothetical protein [Aggregicoccus sp. 17bor-14]
MTHATKWIPLLGLLALAGCRDEVLEVATYRVSGHLVPAYPDPCGECPLGLMMEAVPTGTEGHEQQWPPFSGTANERVRFRQGVELVVEMETRRVDVGDVQDDPGIRKRVLRVLEERPVPAGTRVTMRFPRTPPGTTELKFARVGEEVQLRDGVSTVRVWCVDPSLCDQLAALKPGEQAFELELSHSGVADGPFTAEALRLTP